MARVMMIADITASFNNSRFLHRNTRSRQELTESGSILHTKHHSDYDSGDTYARDTLSWLTERKSVPVDVLSSQAI